MERSLLHLLGAMLVYGDFETQMKVAPSPTLNAWGLSSDEKDVAARLIQSFREGKMEDAIRAVRAECPNWPCN